MKGLAVALLALALTACAKSPAPASGTVSAATSAPAPIASTLAAEFTITDAAQAIALLPQYHWRLAAAHDQSGRAIGALLVRPDKPLQLDFTAHGIAISNTCNRMRASYSTSGASIRIGALAATLMACLDPQLEALDRAAARYLSGTFDFEVSKGAPPTLALQTATGDLLVFRGTPTAMTRFGGAASPD